MRPRWQEIEDENLWLETEYYDYDKDKEMIEKYAIEGGKLPVFVFLDKKGVELERISGEPSKKRLLELIEKYKDR
jgi:thioredoxin-related protein